MLKHLTDQLHFQIPFLRIWLWKKLSMLWRMRNSSQGQTLIHLLPLIIVSQSIQCLTTEECSKIQTLQQMNTQRENGKFVGLQYFFLFCKTLQTSNTKLSQSVSAEDWSSPRQVNFCVDHFTSSSIWVNFQVHRLVNVLWVTLQNQQLIYQMFSVF